MGLREKALSLGATDFGESKVKGKKYIVIYNGRRINFGASGYSDYTTNIKTKTDGRFIVPDIKQLKQRMEIPHI